MVGWSTEQIAQRNEQYRRMEMSNKNSNKPLFRLEALDDSGWQFKMLGSDYLALEQVGMKWVAGKFCTEYSITEVK
jgi:hypothetical protein